MNIEILKPNHFCLFEGNEVGIAVNKYAANRFRENDSNQYLIDTTSQDFGWIDRFGNYYIDNKHNFTRPTNEQIIVELRRYSELFDAALERNLIKLRNYATEDTSS